MAIAWTADLDTGIAAIDAQHRQIVDYLNELEAAMTRKEAGSVGRVLDAVADYCLSHFAFEESLQARVGYAHATAHKAVHDRFAKRLARYRERHEAGEDVAAQLHEMLAGWLLLHIKNEDKNFVPDAARGLREMARDGSEDWLSRAVAGFFGSGAAGRGGRP